MPIVALDARDGFAEPLRGWGRYVRELATGLSEIGDFELVVHREGGAGPELVFEQWRLPRALRRERADLVHAPNCFLPLRRPCPGVVTVHDLAFEDFPEDFAPRTRWKYRTFTRRAARSAERVICDSQFTASDLERRYGVDPARVRVVPLAPALAPGDEPLDDGPPYLLAIGDLRPKKNLRRLVAAWRVLRREGLAHRLVLTGVDAGEGPALRAAAGGEPLELAGYVADGRLDALLRGAAALVHPSLYEGFGLVVLEAMARGVPVACARATALPETAGDAAEYFDPLDEADMAAALRRVLDDSVLRELLVARGRERAAAASWARTATATADVYRELL